MEVGSHIREGLVFSVAGTSVGTHSESTCAVRELEVRLGETRNEGPGQRVSTALPHSSSQFESVASSIKDVIQSLLPGTQLFSSFSFLALPWQ